MDTKTRVAVLTAAGFGAAGALYFIRKKIWPTPEKTLLADFVVPGVSLAISFNVIGMLAPGIPLLAPLARKNGEMGSIPQEAIDLLHNINADSLYANLKKAGLKIAEIPENPSIVLQDDV